MEGMWKRPLFTALLALAAAGGALPARAADLTALEMRWLQAGWPVVTYARQQALPLDIVVQPVDKPGEPPLAMAYVDGRCKLVLSMRGNPEAQATLDQIPAGLVGPVVEAMTAHELGHCWRYVQGAWHTPPAGFADPHPRPAPADPAPPVAELEREMRETRFEEGFADLVGLAWTQRRHPGHYRAVHAWFEAFRADQPLPGAHHDTRAWLRRASDPGALQEGETPFDQALPAWRSAAGAAP